MDFLKEDISEYIEGINSVNDLINRPGSQYLYHRTPGDLNNIRDTGLSREFKDKQAYGYGLYTSLRLEDCINNNGYGSQIIKVWVPGFDRCLIDRGCHVYGHDLAEMIHGRNASVKDQIKKLFKPEYAAQLSDINYIKGSVLTSYDIEPILQENDIDGIIYDWIGGHWVCVWKDYKKAFPMEVSLDNGRTFKTLGDETTIKNVLHTWEPNRVFGVDLYNYNDAEMARCQNGYFVLSRTNDGKYNYFNPKIGKKPLSSVWFDIASPADENGVGTVKFNGHKFWYYIADDEVYEIDGSDTEEALMMNDPIRHSADLLKLVMEDVKPVFGNLLTEALDEYVPNISRDSLDNRNGDITYFYRLSLPHQIKSIASNSFSKEFRGAEGKDKSDWIGSGTYGVVSPTNRTSGNYGSILWKYATPTELVRNTYISPDPYLARKFGIQGSFGEQLERFFPDLVPIWKQKGMWRSILEPSHSGSGMIQKLNKIAFHGSGGKSDYAYHSHGVNGIIYHGNNDGDAVITFDDASIIPVAWKDNSKPYDNWHPIEITDTLWNRTFNGYDPLVFLKGTYRDYSDNPNEISQNYRVINNYMLVCRKDNHKYNYIKAPEGGKNFASSVWFDVASPIDENGMGTVKFNGHKFWYYAPEDEIYEIDGTDTEEALMMNDPIGHSADLPKITSGANLEENTGIFGKLLEETLKK
jgi:hypothetical protein